MKKQAFFRVAGLLLAMVLSVSLFPMQVQAAEPDAEAGQKEEQTFIEEPYLRVNLASLYSTDRLKVESVSSEKSNVEVSLREDQDGIWIKGTVSELNDCKIVIRDHFVFNGNPVGRICVDGLADAGISAGVQVYLDDNEAPSASISLVNASGWSEGGNRTVDVYAQRISGEHQVSIGFGVTGQSEETVSILLRNLEFAENSIPVLYFDLDESQGTIDEMNASPDHSANCYGAVDIQVPEGYQSEYMDSVASDLNDLKLEYIRGRGNSTWNAEKKAYKVKFDKKQDLFGMGKNKHWVLIANRYDNTLLHNRITYWLTAQMGMEFTPQCLPVEVVMNGRYFGSYLLCEQIRVDENRIEIDELTADITDEPEITGGYFLSVEPYEDDPEAGKFTTNQGVNFYINDPGYEEADDEGTDAHKAYISQYVQDTEDAIFGEDFKDANGKSYQEYLDIDSTIDYWWVQEFTMNRDAYKTPSTYLYKKRDGKLYWGPLWDFDSEAWGNIEYDPERYEITSFYKTSVDSIWMNQLMFDPTFAKGLEERWPEINALLNKIVDEGGILDQYYNETKISQRYDNELYGFYDPSGYIQEHPEHTYDDEISLLKTWIRARQKWINENLGMLEDIVCTVTFIVDGEETPFAQEKVLRQYPIGSIPDAPEKDGFVWIGWQTEDGTSIDDIFGIEDDMTFYAYYISDEEAILAEDIFFQLPEFWTELKDETFTIMYKYTTVPEDNQEKMVKWTSSDESIATVNEYGQVFFRSAGTVTITATLKNGKSKSYQLHILESQTPEYTKLEDLLFEQDTITMQVGEYAQNILHIQPEGLLDDSPILLFSSDNEDVVTVDDFGVLHAVGEGTAVITVKELSYDKTASYVANVSAKTDEKDSEEIVYTFSKGGNGIWTKGDTKTFDLTVHRNVEDNTTFSHFKDIAVDGTVIDEKNYDAVSGSLNASLKADYLNTLSVGAHTIAVHFDDGSAETKLTVKETAASGDAQNGSTINPNQSKNGTRNGGTGKSVKRSSTSVNTGDDTHAAVWLVILLAAAAGLVMTRAISYRSKRDSK